MEMCDVLLIGSGLSGLSCAQELMHNGYNVIVVDKGYLPGGRTASKKVETPLGVAHFDYGAQYFTVDSIEFLKQVNEWNRKGLVHKWATDFKSTTVKQHEIKPRYKALPDMRSLCQDLAQPLTVHQRTKITRIEWDGTSWQSFSEDGRVFSSKKLVITAPIVQSLALCYQSGIIPAFDTVNFFNQQKYHACITLLIVSDTDSLIPEPGGMWCDPTSELQWMADNKKKGISELTSITTNLSAEASRKFYNLYDEAIFAQLKPVLSEYIPGNWVFTGVHRWRYAQPINIVETGFINDDYYTQMWFAGDVFLNGRVESAWLSGYKTARDIIAKS